MLKLLRNVLESGEHPLIYGETGVGKTRTMAALAKWMGLKLFTICLSHREGVEVHGNQVLNNEVLYMNDKPYPTTRQAPPSYVIEAINESNGALIGFDELNRIPITSVGPTLAIFSEWIIGEVDLPRERIGMIAAMNPPGYDVACFKMPNASLRRFVPIPFKVDVMEWTEKFPSYWNDPPVVKKWGKVLSEDQWGKARTIVASFIRQFPEMLIKIPKNSEEKFPTCSTWEQVSRFLVTTERDGLNDNERQEILTGCVGPGAATQFAEWYAHRHFPDPVELLKSIDNLPSNLKAEDYFYIVRSLTEEIKRRCKVAKAEPLSDPKLQQYAIEGWQKIWDVFVECVNRGCPRDIPTLATNEIAPIMPKGARPPKNIKMFVDTVDAAGVNWDMTGTPGTRR